MFNIPIDQAVNICCNKFFNIEVIGKVWSSAFGTTVEWQLKLLNFLKFLLWPLMKKMCFYKIRMTFNLTPQNASHFILESKHVFAKFEDSLKTFPRYSYTHRSADEWTAIKQNDSGHDCC